MYETQQTNLHRSFWNILNIDLLVRGLFEPASNLLDSARYEELVIAGESALWRGFTPLG